ncbi:MAG: RNA-binding protein [Thermoprotei archaeon]|nr:MAG: RNA-binding protein [Thermoprotei archaeon]
MKEKLVKTRYRLSKKDAKKLLNKIEARLGSEILDKLSTFAFVEKVDTRLGFSIYLFDKKPILLERKDIIFPTILHADIFREILPIVVVDMGAVPHIINGADVMVPGIREVDKPFNEGTIVLIADEEKLRIFCIGLALMSSREIFSEKRGRAVKNLHHVKDKIWNLILRL